MTTLFLELVLGYLELQFEMHAVTRQALGLSTPMVKDGQSFEQLPIFPTGGLPCHQD